jgi:hypothetical protein
MAIVRGALLLVEGRALGAVQVEDDSVRRLDRPGARTQAAVGGDLRPVEFELEPAVEGDPERGLPGFARRIGHDQPIRPLP